VNYFLKTPTFGKVIDLQFLAGVAQLVEHQLPKLRVASSSLVSCSFQKLSGISRAAFLMIPYLAGFLQVSLRHFSQVHPSFRFSHFG
jgi:hypothetical protein